MRKHVLLHILCFGICLTTSTSYGQDVATEADLLFRHGGELFKVGKYDEALLSFLASNRLARNRNALYNIAFCYLRLGQYDNAFRFLSEYQREQLTPAEQKIATDEMERLRPRVALISLTSEPSAATIYVDRRDLGARGTTPAVLALSPGRHTIIFELPGYHGEQRVVDLAMGHTVRISVQARLRLGTVKIEAQPRGATVRVDRDHGPSMATAPASLELVPGRHAIYFSHPGYRTARTDVDVRGGETVPVAATLEPAPLAPGKLVVTASPRGAVVAVDGQVMGASPVTLEVAAGRHQVTVTDEDYLPFRGEVVLAPGERKALVARLTLAPEGEVGAASKMAQAVEDAASSVAVLSGEEIRALGYRTLGEALRGVRGFYLSDDRQYQMIGVRGSSSPGDLNPRFLVLSDGHSMSDVWTGANFVGRDFAADLSDVERIEVVRGPGSALYGTGAFFGLVDVTTRSREEQRFDLELGGGSLGEVVGHGAVYQSFARRAAARLAAGFVYSPRGGDFADPTGTGFIEDNDGEKVASANGRISLGDFTFTGRFNERKKELPTAAYQILPGTGRAFIDDRRAFFEARYEQDLGGWIHLLARGYYDHMRYNGRWPYSESSAEDLTDEGAADWVGAEARLVLRPRPWINIVAGAEGLYAPSVKQAATASSEEPLAEENRVGSGSGYALGEVKLPHDVRLLAGLRCDYSTTGGFSPSPDAAILWRPYARGSSKFLFGRAFRAPSVYEIYYHDGGVSQVPSVDLGPETIYTWQLEHTHAFGGRWYLTGGVYYNDVRGLIALGPEEHASSIPCVSEEGCIQFRNLGHVGTLGAEVELRRAFGPGGSVSVAYAFQRSRDLEAGSFFGDDSIEVVNSPEHLAYARLVRPLVRDFLTLGAELIYGSPRVRRDGEKTAHMLLANLTLSGHVQRALLRYALSVYNAFDWRYGVPVGSEYPDTQMEVAQLGRTVMATLGTSF